MTARDEARATIFDEIEIELVKADRHHRLVFASLHEAFAVILEETDELWALTRQRRKNRSAIEIRTELIQIAAMAIKAIHSMPNFVGGPV